MKKKSSISYRLSPLLLIFFIMSFSLFASFFSFSQTNFYNGGTDITVYPNTILFVDGHVSNTVQGFIHNQGDIYLTGDWTNSEPLGCLDPTTGTVILSGATQTIQGTQTTTFNNLDLQGVGTKTLDINTIVAGNTGVLSLNSNTFDLNSKTVIVTNPASTAITRTSGYIISETDPGPGYGRIQWNLGNTSSNYTYPFGTISGTYIPFLYDVTSAGAQSTIGNISVATYPTSVTSIPNNRPLPSGVTNLNAFSGDESDVTCADRFWVVDATNYSSNPTADLTFTYRDDEWDLTGGSTNDIVEDSLKGWMWSGIQWQNPAFGTCNVTNNTVNVTGINTYAPWTLNAGEPPPYVCSELTTPNAFSPNNDGRSDLFILQGWEKCITSFYFAIFNRWGEKVFETENIAEGWDGTYKGKPLDPAVFVYYIKAKDLTGEEVNKKGNISLIR
ncbi:MAG: gliding motility-associated C-terminal domain-containing protein [Bacteroidota bacterium]